MGEAFRSAPALLPVGLVAARNFDSFEELAAWAPAWVEEEVQLGRGRFRGRIVVAHSARLQLGLVARRPGILARGRPPPGTRVVGLSLSAQPAFFQGRPIRRGDVLVVRGGTRYEFRAPGSHVIFLAAVEEERLARHALGRARARSLDANGTMRVQGREAERALLRAWYGELRRALANPGSLVDPLPAERFEERVIDALLEATTEVPGVRGVPRVDPVRRAEEYLEGHLDEPVTVSELSRAVGVPVRTLHSGFRRSLGFTPKAYAKVLRLNAARVDLRKAGPGVTVSQVAVRWGFFHLGYFSVDYRRMFGESPSDTLHQR